MRFYITSPTVHWTRVFGTTTALFVCSLLVAGLALYAPISARAELIGYWNFENNVTDQTGKGNNGNATGDPYYSDDFPGAVTGNTKSMAFDGFDDIVTITHSSAGFPITNNPAFTLSFWVKGGGQSEVDRRVFSETSTSSDRPMFALGTPKDDPNGASLDFFTRPDIGPALVNHWRSDQAVFDDTWHHVAWVDVAGQVRVYVDGVLDTSFLSYNDPLTTLNTTSFGGMRQLVEGSITDRYLFTGLIDEAAVWNEALGPNALAWLAEGGAPSNLPKEPILSYDKDKIALPTSPPGGDIVTASMTITNSGKKDLTITSINPDALEDFTINTVLKGTTETIIAPYVMSPGSSLVTTIGLDPLSQGMYSGSFTIISNDTRNPTQKIDVTAIIDKSDCPITDGMILHVDASKGIIKETGTEAISFWADLSGSGHDISQYNSSQMPKLIPNGLNGKPFVQFDGVDDMLFNPSVSNSWPTHEVTAIIMAKAAIAKNAYAFTMEGETVTTGMASVLPRANGNVAFIFGDYTANGGGAIGGVWEATDQHNIWTMRSSMAEQTQHIYRNNELMGSDADASEYAHNNEAFCLGGSGQFNNYFWVGEMVEVMIFNTALSPGDLNDIGYYLSEKYGLDNTYTPPAPKIVALPSISDFGWVSTGATNATQVNRIENIGSDGSIANVIAINDEELDKFSLVSVMKNSTTTLEFPYTTTLSSGEYIEVTLTVDASASGDLHETIYVGWEDTSDPKMEVFPLDIYGRIGEPSRPPFTDGLALHLAAENVTVLRDYAPAAKWFDSSGSGNHGLQGNIGSQPLYMPNAVNGKPVLRFDGENDSLNIPAPLSNFPTNEVTVIFVAKTDVEQNSSVFSSLPQTASDRFLGSLPWGDGRVIWDCGSNDSAGRLEVPGFDTFSDYNIWSMRSSVAEAKQHIFQNGTIVAEDDTAQTINFAGKSLEIAQIRREGYYSGDIAEMMVFNKALSETEHNTIGWYLQSKYGIAGTYTEPTPQVSMSVIPLDVRFGLIPIDGQPKTRTITIRDAGYITPLVISSITLDNTDFSIVKVMLNGISLPDPYEATLSSANHDVLEITVSIGPKPLGVYTGNITINSNDPDTAALDIPLSAQPSSWSDQDIGFVSATGSTSITGTVLDETFSITASGVDIWGTADEFHYVYKSLKGDGSITARVASINPLTVHEWSKAGIMIREDLTAGSPEFMCLVSPLHGTLYQWRKEADIASQSLHKDLRNTEVPPYWLRITREGNTFMAYISLDGEEWVMQDDEQAMYDANTMPVDLVMPEEVFIGLALTSHLDGSRVTAVFDNVTVTGDVSSTPPPFGAPWDLDLAEADDTGAANDDDLTMNTSNLHISGKATSGTTVTLLNGTIVLTTGTAEEFSNPGLEIDLNEGTCCITAFATLEGVNSDPSSTLTITVHTEPPVVELSSTATDPTPDSPIPVAVSFTEEVFGFALDDLTVTNGTASNFVGGDGDMDFTVDITPAAEGTVIVDIVPGAATDLAGNAITTGTQLTRLYDVPATYSLIVDIVGGGAVATDPQQADYLEETQVSLSPEPETGQKFTGWSGDISEGSEMSIPLVITMDSNKSITATFANIINQYALTIISANGSIVTDPAGSPLDEGTNVTITATPDTGFEFTGWSGADVPAGTEMDNPLAITIDAAKTITANYALLTFALDALADAGGSVATNPVGPVHDYGTTVTITATPNKHYHFVAWVGPGVPAGAEDVNPATVVMNAPTTLTATFAIDTYTLATMAENGVINVEPVQAVYAYGTTVTLAAVPAAGYIFTNWGDGAAGEANTVVITISENTTVTANFELIPIHSIAVDAGAGSISQVPVGTNFDEGTAITITAIPPVGYSFDAWTGAPPGMESDNPIMLNIDADMTLTATFVINTYAVNVSFVGSGSVSKTPADGLYEYGATVSLAATPAANNNFSGWTGVPTGQELDNPIVLTVSENLDVVASFTINQHLLSVTADAGGSVTTIPPDAVYDYGSVVEINAIPDEGFAFAGWTGDVPAGQELVNPLTITIDADKTVRATFYTLPSAADYKVTYKNCAIDVDGDGNFAITGTSTKSTLKISLLKKPPKSTEPKAGKYFYAIGLRVIPAMVIDGALAKLSTDIEVWNLASAGPIKRISTKNTNIAWIEAPSVGSIKNTCLVDATAGKAQTCSVMLTGSGAAAKISFNGIVLENLVSNQPLKSLAVGSKAYKHAVTKTKLYSLGGIGAVERVVAQAAGLANTPVEGDSMISAPAIVKLTAKGAPLTPDTIQAGLSKVTVQGGSFKTSTIVTIAADLVVRCLVSTTPIKSITGKAKKVSGVPIGGRIGSLADPNLTRIQAAGDIASITGQDIAAIIWAGFTADTPTHTGFVKKITSKGILAGAAHVSADPKVKAVDSTAFAVIIQ